jgi:hypothetical protein
VVTPRRIFVLSSQSIGGRRDRFTVTLRRILRGNADVAR